MTLTVTFNVCDGFHVTSMKPAIKFLYVSSADLCWRQGEDLCGCIVQAAQKAVRGSSLQGVSNFLKT